MCTTVIANVAKLTLDVAMSAMDARNVNANKPVNATRNLPALMFTQALMNNVSTCRGASKYCFQVIWVNV